MLQIQHNYAKIIVKQVEKFVNTLQDVKGTIPLWYLCPNVRYYLKSEQPTSAPLFIFERLLGFS